MKNPEELSTLGKITLGSFIATGAIAPIVALRYTIFKDIGESFGQELCAWSGSTLISVLPFKKNDFKTFNTLSGYGSGIGSVIYHIPELVKEVRDEYKLIKKRKAVWQFYVELSKISESIDNSNIYSSQTQIDNAIKDIIRRDQKPNAKSGDMKKLQNLIIGTELIKKKNNLRDTTYDEVGK